MIFFDTRSKSHFLTGFDPKKALGSLVFTFFAIALAFGFAAPRLPDGLDFFQPKKVLTSQDTLEATVCAGDAVVFGGDTLAATGFYSDTLAAADGSDSILVLDLLVLPPNVKRLLVRQCVGTEYIFHGDTIAAPGVYFDTLTAANGCDSTVILRFETVTEFLDTIRTAICDGDTLFAEGDTLTAAGFYSYIYVAAGGCDSTVTIDLDVRQPTASAFSATICANEAFAIGGFSLTAAGIYTVVLTNAAGCDSTVTIDLAVLPTAASAVSAAICAGQFFAFSGQFLTIPGQYSEVLIAANGCDSTVTLDLTVLPNAFSNQSATICAGESFLFNGQNLTASGVFTATLTAANGCDSTVALALTVLPNAATNLSAAICAGGAFLFGGQTLTTAGIFRDTLSAANGCDSVVTLNLSVLPTAASAVSAAICAGQFYAFNGQFLTVSGQYSAILTAANGCDSTVTLDLTVLPTASSNQSATICEGQSFLFNGQNLTASGVFTAVLTAANGCDSTVALALNVLPKSNTSLAATICSNETFSFAGQNLATAGTYAQILTAANGCDSTVTLTLAVLPTKGATVTAAICTGASYAFGGQNISASGAYLDTLAAANGCDSVVTLNLTVSDTLKTALAATICSNSAYLFAGQTLTTAGIYTDTLTAAGGCDSVVTLTLNVLPVKGSTAAAAVCAGQFFAFNGQFLTASGQYTAVLTAANGCDSTVTLDLTVLPNASSNQSATICAGQSYLFNGQSLTASGIFTATLTAANGCDSTVALALNVLPTAASASTATICAGQVFAFNGKFLTISGQYSAVLVAANGCDSTVTVDLTVLPTASSNQSATICEGQSYLFNGQNLSSAGVFTATLTAANGCDSTVALALNVLPASHSLVAQTICAGEVFAFNGQNLTAAGNYSATLTAANGCDSTVTLALFVAPTSSSSVAETICFGEALAFNGQNLTVPGVYTAILTAANGCDSTVTLTLTVDQPTVTTTLAGNTLTGTVSAGAVIQWADCTTQQPIFGQNGPTFTPTATGVYTAVAISANGCTAVAPCTQVTIVATDEPNAPLFEAAVRPNPASSEAWVELFELPTAAVWVEIFDASGRFVSKTEAAKAAAFRLDLEAAPTGVLILKITDGQRSAVKRLVKIAD